MDDYKVRTVWHWRALAVFLVIELVAAWLISGLFYADGSAGFITGAVAATLTATVWPFCLWHVE